MLRERRTVMTNKIYLSEDEMPVQYYNLRSDMKIKPVPLLNPATLQPVTKDELTPVFCQELVEQELDDTTRFFDIPGKFWISTRLTALLH